jgi:hypothetical protein
VVHLDLLPIPFDHMRHRITIERIQPIEDDHARRQHANRARSETVGLGSQSRVGGQIDGQCLRGNRVGLRSY